MKEFAIYTAARLGVFLVTYAVIIALYLLTTGNDQVPLFWPFLLAVIVSAIASLTLLRKQRDAFAGSVQRRAERSAARRRMVEAEEQRTAAETPSPEEQHTAAERPSPEDEPGR